MPTCQATKVKFWADPDDPRHGTTNGYINLRCRCERCLTEGRAYHNAAGYYRPYMRPTPDHLHGTDNAYSNYGCRCLQCQVAHVDYEVGRKAKRAAQRAAQRAEKAAREAEE